LPKRQLIRGRATRSGDLSVNTRAVSGGSCSFNPLPAAGWPRQLD